jgi:uncharacterized LabA/DUF88 family protein
MITTSDVSPRLAVLIDADNAQPSIADGLLVEVANYGTAHVKRAYGDWTGAGLRGWKEQLHSHSIQPMQQFSYTTGKNATDAAMIIDAMDLLYTGRFDGFCIISSDSDFTRLASRLRESGLTVYGFGERKTPKPFVSACDKFIYTENLRTPAASTAPTGNVPTAPRALNPEQLRADTALVNQLSSAVEAASGEDGWSPLATVGHPITKQRSDFDARTYGYPKLGLLIEATGLFESERRGVGDGKAAVVWVRDRQRQP